MDVTLLSALDWQEERFSGLRLAFILASRRTGDPSRDIDDELRREMIRKLERSGGQQGDIRLIEEIVPVEQKDRSVLFGEALPLGLRAIGE